MESGLCNFNVFGEEYTELSYQQALLQPPESSTPSKYPLHYILHPLLVYWYCRFHLRLKIAWATAHVLYCNFIQW